MPSTARARGGVVAVAEEELPGAVDGPRERREEWGEGAEVSLEGCARGLVDGGDGDSGLGFVGEGAGRGCVQGEGVAERLRGAADEDVGRGRLG